MRRVLLSRRVGPRGAKMGSMASRGMEQQQQKLAFYSSESRGAASDIGFAQLCVDKNDLVSRRRASFERQFEQAKARVESQLWSKWEAVQQQHQENQQPEQSENDGPVENDQGELETVEQQAAGHVVGEEAGGAAGGGASASARTAGNKKDGGEDEDAGLDDWEFEFEPESLDRGHGTAGPSGSSGWPGGATALSSDWDAVADAMVASGLYSPKSLQHPQESDEADSTENGRRRRQAAAPSQRAQSAAWFSYRFLPAEEELPVADGISGAMVDPSDFPPVSGSSLSKKKRIVGTSDETFSVTEARFRARRVALHVRLAALNLPECVQERLLAIVGPARVDSDTGVLKLVSDAAPSRSGNCDRVQLMLRALLAASYEVDSNYVPPPPGTDADPSETAEKVLSAKLLADEVAVRDGIYRLLVQDGVEPDEARQRADNMELGPAYRLPSNVESDLAIDSDGDGDHQGPLKFDENEFVLVKFVPPVSNCL